MMFPYTDASVKGKHMKSRNLLIIPILLCILFAMGCSSGGDTPVPDPTASTPTFTTDASKTYTDKFSVKISSKEDLGIYYTTDGTTPTTDSERYSYSIFVDKNGETTIKAIAAGTGYKTSEVATKTYAADWKCEDPKLSSSTGTYIEDSLVIGASSDTTLSATFYTINGNDPTVFDHKYTFEEPIVIEKNTTTPVVLKTKTFKDDYKPSEVISATYTFTNDIKPTFAGKADFAPIVKTAGGAITKIDDGTTYSFSV
jgi:hypothetical protein